MLRPLILLLAASSVVGCTADTRRYPSLAPRAAEKQSFAEPVVGAAVVTPDPALDARLVKLAADLDHVAAGFTTAAEGARRSATVVARQPVGSEAWLTAQAALARVDDWRAQAGALAAEVEAAASTRAAALQPAYPALDALAARAAAETDREAQEADRLQRLLPAAHVDGRASR